MTNEGMLLLLLIVVLALALPAWPYSRSWGYVPTGVLTIIVVVLLIWVVAGGRSLRSPGQHFKSDMQALGQDVKDGAKDMGDSLKRAVQ